MDRLVYQAGHSLVWRDSITNFYWNKSGIADTKGRVGKYKYRIEAESMKLDGYKTYKVSPFESASGSWAIVTSANNTQGTASTKLDKIDSGLYNLAVNYFDVAVGNATWEVWLGENMVGKWKGDNEYKFGKAPTFYIDGQSATRVTFKKVWVENGAELKIVGIPDGNEAAPLDYVSILPLGIVD